MLGTSLTLRCRSDDNLGDRPEGTFPMQTEAQHARRTPLRQRARAPTEGELAMIPWLVVLDSTERERALDGLQVVEALPGEFLCKLGRQANYWFGLLDGLLKMSNDSSQ